MKFLSVCSGIEAASVAWNPLGWEAIAFSEIEKFPCKVLAHHYPKVPNLGDLTHHAEWKIEQPDLLIGGTPCQSFSVAGLREGLADPRGQLALVYLQLADRVRPRWIVWENVPGVLSADKGRAFGSFLGALAEIGYGWAYRVLDAQYFGVPQRRRRVFVVGCLGDWRSAAAVLFERASLRGDPAPSREARESPTYPVAPSIRASGRGFSRAGETRGQDPVVAHALRGEGFDASEDGTGRGTPLVAHTLDVRCRSATEDGTGRGSPLVAMTLNAHAGRIDGESETFLPVAFDTTQITSATNRCNPQAGDPCHPLAAGAHAPAIAFPVAMVNMQGSKGMAVAQEDGPSFTLNAMHGHDVHAIAFHSRQDPIHGEVMMPLEAKGGQAVAFDLRGREGGSQFEGPHGTANLRAASGGSSRSYVAATAVRRLTPRECERLQGFPDDFTLIPGAKDGPRYKALGNSIAVPVLRWIGERIATVEEIRPEALDTGRPKA